MKTLTESGTLLIKNRRIVFKSEKRVVLDGRRVMKQNTMKDPLYVVSHEMCRKREQKRERGQLLVLFFSFEHVPIII
jgi:hypothetical protein